MIQDTSPDPVNNSEMKSVASILTVKDKIAEWIIILEAVIESRLIREVLEDKIELGRRKFEMFQAK